MQSARKIHRSSIKPWHSSSSNIKSKFIIFWRFDRWLLQRCPMHWGSSNRFSSECSKPHKFLAQVLKEQQQLNISFLHTQLVCEDATKLCDIKKGGKKKLEMEKTSSPGVFYFFSSFLLINLQTLYSWWDAEISPRLSFTSQPMCIKQ